MYGAVQGSGVGTGSVHSSPELAPKFGYEAPVAVPAVCMGHCAVPFAGEKALKVGQWQFTRAKARSGACLPKERLFNAATQRCSGLLVFILCSPASSVRVVSMADGGLGSRRGWETLGGEAAGKSFLRGEASMRQPFGSAYVTCYGW